MSEPETLGEDLLPGTVIAGKYEVGAVLGAGGMGRVYRATQINLGTPVCIKTLHSGATADPEFAARFEREARSTSLLRHPNIVSVFDYGNQVDGSSYLVMELVDGLPLSKVTKRKPQPADWSVQVLAQVCDALQFAHDKGVIHRDLKPANIMVSDLSGQQVIKVLDFGSAFTMEEGQEAQRLTRQGMVLGTPSYMAPEYILGRGTDARVDVYAVGTLLYALLTGGPPFRGNTQAVFAQQISVSPERPSFRCPEASIPAAVEAVCMKALIKDPARRYGSARELKEAMLAALAAGDAKVEFETDGGAGVGVELARDERPVVMISIRRDDGITPELVNHVGVTARPLGGLIAQSEGRLDVVFALDRDVPGASPEAMRFATRLESPQGELLRIGMHDAQASVQGRFGQPGFEYELFGDGIEIARKLSRRAGLGRVLVSGPLSRYVPLELRLRPVPPPPDVHEPAFLLGDPVRDAIVEGQLPFVGRSQEQRKLLEVAVNAKQGSVLVLSGPAGAGKTRLLKELVGQAGQLDVLWSLVSATGEMGPSHPTSALAALGWSSKGASGSTTERYVVALMLGQDTSESNDLSGERRQLRLVAAAIEGVTRRATEGPVVAVLDELHIADDTTWGCARRLVEMAPELGVSVVLSVRDIEEIPFTLPAEVPHLELPPLKDREVLSLVSRSRIPLDKAQTDALLKASQGNALMADELLKTCALHGAGVLLKLAERDPADVEALICRLRLRELGDSSRRLLDAAAILGHRPHETEARELADVGLDYDSALAELSEASLLRREGGRLELRFQALRPVVLELLNEGMFRLMHSKAAEMLVDLGVGRAAEAGQHLLLGGDAEGAFTAFRKASDFAHTQGSTRTARDCLEAALRAGQQIDGHSPRDKAAVARDLGRLCIELGELARAETVLRVAFPWAREATDDHLAADLLRLHGHVISLQGDYEDGRGEIEAAFGFAKQKNLPLVAAEACGDLAEGYERDGELEHAKAVLERGLEIVDEYGDAEAGPVRIRLYNRLGRLELKANELTSAIAVFTQALALAEKLQDRHQEAGLLGNLGGSYARRKDLERALHFTERAQRASDALGDQIGVARQSFNLAILHLSVGQRDRAEGLLRTSHEAARRAGWREGLAMSTAALNKLGARI